MALRYRLLSHDVAGDATLNKAFVCIYFRRLFVFDLDLAPKYKYSKCNDKSDTGNRTGVRVCKILHGSSNPPNAYCNVFHESILNDTSKSSPYCFMSLSEDDAWLRKSERIRTRALVVCSRSALI